MFKMLIDAHDKHESKRTKNVFPLKVAKFMGENLQLAREHEICLIFSMFSFYNNGWKAAEISLC